MAFVIVNLGKFKKIKNKKPSAGVGRYLQHLKENRSTFLFVTFTRKLNIYSKS